MKVSDYIANFLKVNGVSHVFGVQGGAVVHLFDSLEKTNGISAVYCHHEQASALAAVSNAKIKNTLGCSIVTTGPASTNAITGLLAAWQDSVPVIFISGQTRVEHTSYGKSVRQVGSQEFNILDIVKPITKYSKLVTSAKEIPAIFEEAIQKSLEGRMGPVWIDIPVNIQWEDFDYEAPQTLEIKKLPIGNKREVTNQFTEIMQLIQDCKRPLIIAGNGIRASKSEINFLKFLNKTKIPFVSTWTSADLTFTDNYLFGGIIGVAGQRGANKALYEADLIICLGTHLAITQTSTLFDEFAKNAKKAIIDIDLGELENLNILFDLKIHSDLKDFFLWLENINIDYEIDQKWLDSIQKLKELNSTLLTLNLKSSIGSESNVNSNYFNFMLTSKIPSNSNIVIDGGGTALYTGFQSTILKENQRIICSSAISAMGTGLPESIGVAFGLPTHPVYCVIGDGSLMFNIQELQTIFHHKLPIKIIVYNNNGYLAIKHTQKSFLNEKYFGTDIDHGISFPSIKKVAECFQLDYIRVDSIDKVESLINQIIQHPGPLMVEVVVPSDQSMLFQQGYKEISTGRFQPCNLSEMQPFLNQ
jgi:acetolactate synthase-1/2/3 large subunit